MALSSRRGHSNILSIIDSTTPSVSTHTLPKWSFQEWDELWLLAGRNNVEFFNLRDLWTQYTEWSAYGVGAEIHHLPGGSTVKQYYVPYLSAIQIYTSQSRASSRNGASNCWSNGDAYKKLVKPRGSAELGETSTDREGTQLAQERYGYLYFQFVENVSPHGRLPLFDKVRELANIYPGLMSFKSAELSPASWMSVAWYPIYHIPTRPTVKDLSACFLTYHSLGPSRQGELGSELHRLLEVRLLEVANQVGIKPAEKFLTLSKKSSCIKVLLYVNLILMGEGFDVDYNVDDGEDHTQASTTGSVSYPRIGKSGSKSEEKNNRICLHPFGLATYNAWGKLWVNPENGDNERIVSLYNAANSWLSQLNVQHNDFLFFTTH